MRPNVPDSQAEEINQMLERMNESPEYMPFKLKLQKIMDKAELQLETEESNGWV